MSIRFPYGGEGAFGKTPEMIARDDYPFLRYLFDQGIRVSELRKRTEEVIIALNNFIPVDVKCAASNCKEPITHMSGILRDGISLSTGFLYCKDHFRMAYDSGHPKVKVYRSGFDSLLKVKRFPKYLRQDMADFLWMLTGIERRTQEKLEEFVYKINARIRGRLF